MVSNPGRWKSDSKGFKGLLSLPRLSRGCFDVGIHSCATQIRMVTVLSGTARSWEGLYSDLKLGDKQKLQQKGRYMHNTYFIDS